MFFPIAYYNNEFQLTQDISINSKDLGLHRGYSVFDFFKLKDLANPNFDDYMRRFFNSCASVKLYIKKDREELYNIANNVLIQNNTRDGYIKIIATAGSSSNGFNHDNNPSLLVMAMPLKQRNEQYYTKGTKLLLSSYRRDIPQVKTTNYMHAAMHADILKESKAIDLLYHDDGLIREAARCNIFLIKDTELFTPSAHILHGITRKRVLNTDIGIAHNEQDIPLNMLESVDEIFITSTTKGVMPIVQVDDLIIGSGKVGPITKRYMEKINGF